MSKARRLYTMHKKLFHRILKTEGKPPTCRQCGRTLLPGLKVFSKRTKNGGSSRIQRYCNQCRTKLKIWVR